MGFYTRRLIVLRLRAIKLMLISAPSSQLLNPIRSRPSEFIGASEALRLVLALGRHRCQEQGERNKIRLVFVVLLFYI